MDKKYLTFFIVLVIVDLVTCRSFSIVVDTTVSMEDELQTIKNQFPAVANLLENSVDFQNFVVVPFNDPDVETPLVTSRPERLLNVINSLTANGGSDCPEDSLAGIQKGLELSQSGSQIYVFTDAYAKYNRNFNEIEELCKRTQSQIIIFLSGDCTPAESIDVGSMDVYYDIATACSGAVFRLEAINLKKAFKYIKEMIKTDYNEIANHVEFNGYKQFTFTVDTLTTDLLLAISGEYPVLQIVDSSGSSPHVEKIVDMRKSLVVRLSNLEAGQYRASARCNGPTFVTFYKRTRMPFEYGFSTRIPNSLRETSLRPIPGWTNYIFIKLHDNYNIRIDSMELEYIKANDRKTLTIYEKDNQRGCYIATVFIEPAKPFKIAITGKDLTKYEDITKSTKIINPQTQVQTARWQAPTSEIIVPESNFIDYGANTTLSCKVIGYPKPSIWWTDDKYNTLQSEDILLEMPSTYLSYVDVVSVMSNVTLYCKSKNSFGEDVTSTQIFVNRTFTFEILQEPEDTTIQYGESGKIYCEVDAYPEAEIKWYHNGTSVDYAGNIEVNDEENALEIKNMTLSDIGTYTCEVSNIANRQTLTATVSISGLEMPEVQVTNEEVIMRPGDWMDVECSIKKGFPAPTITWKYKSQEDYEFKSLPKEVANQKGRLQIASAKWELTGTYRCIATNMLGEGSVDVTVKIQYAPQISRDGEETLTVKEGDTVELSCKVDAVPAATVRWEMKKDDVIIPFDDGHSTNDESTHSFTALWKDSGSYSCIAENEMGRTEKTITVNVLVAPYIEPPEFYVWNVTTGDSLSLPCNVLYGNPAPTTKWQFIALDSPPVALSRNTNRDKNNVLTLTNITKAHEGLYLCIAENDVSNDRIKMYIRVK